jgi:hypothetical protein
MERWTAQLSRPIDTAHFEPGARHIRFHYDHLRYDCELRETTVKTRKTASKHPQATVPHTARFVQPHDPKDFF